MIGLHLQNCELKLSGFGAKLSWQISNLKEDCKLRKTCIKKRKRDTEGIWIQFDEFYLEKSELFLTSKEAADFDFMIEAHFFSQTADWVESERVSLLYDSFDILAKKQEEISGEILFCPS